MLVLQVISAGKGVLEQSHFPMEFDCGRRKGEELKTVGDFFVVGVAALTLILVAECLGIWFWSTKACAIYANTKVAN